MKKNTKPVSSQNDRMYHVPFIVPIATEDGVCLPIREDQYQASWKERGGIGAFMMLGRKWDRIEAASKKVSYDIFTAIGHDAGSTGLIDDIRDLRGYLILVEAEMRALGIVGNVRPNISQSTIDRASRTLLEKKKQ